METSGSYDADDGNRGNRSIKPARRTRKLKSQASGTGQTAKQAARNGVEAIAKEGAGLLADAARKAKSVTLPGLSGRKTARGSGRRSTRT
jgi:hypothetical protein